MHGSEEQGISSVFTSVDLWSTDDYYKKISTHIDSTHTRIESNRINSTRSNRLVSTRLNQLESLELYRINSIT